MSTTYYITTHLRMPHGMLETGRFFVGRDKEFALQLFNSLKGSSAIDKHLLLRIDLIVTGEKGPEIPFGSISCTLNEYTESCKIITREVFKYFTLENRQATS